MESMDCLTFIVEMTRSLAWPIVVLILGFAFRQKLNLILAGVRKIKVGSVEAEIEERTRQVEQAAVEIDDAEPDESPLGVSYSDAEDRLRETARSTPRGAILEAWLLVESAAIDLLRTKRVHEFKSHPGPAQIRNQLIKGNLLSAAQRVVLERLRELRNDAVHVPDASIGLQDAYRYIESARKLAYSLEKMQSN